MPATILIIEDHASVRTLLARVLEDAGYQAARPPMASRGSNGSANSLSIWSLRIWRCPR